MLFFWTSRCFNLLRKKVISCHLTFCDVCPAPKSGLLRFQQTKNIYRRAQENKRKERVKLADIWAALRQDGNLLSAHLFYMNFLGMKFVEHDSPCCVDLHLSSRVFPVLGDDSRLAARNIIMMKQHCWPARDGSPLSTSESWWKAFHPPKLFEPSRTHKQTMTRRWENIGWEGLSLKRLG